MNYTKLSFTCHATVASVYRDGYDDPDYLSFTLKIPSWGDNTLFARLQNREGEAFPALGGRFNFRGEFLVDPGKEWTRTYFYIQSYEALHDEPTEIPPPKFALVAEVRRIDATSTKVYWRVWDEYENATYPQVFNIMLDQTEGNITVGRQYQFEGVAEDADRFRATTIKLIA
jgi:hypothetical protein